MTSEPPEVRDSSSHRDSFAALWAAAAKEHASNQFLLFRSDDGSVATWTYQEFDDAVMRVAAALRRAGVKPGDSVYLVLRNCPAFIALWLAVARLGAWMVPVDPASAARDVASHLRRVRPTVAIIASEKADAGRNAAFWIGAGDTQITVVEVDESAADLEPGGVFADSDVAHPAHESTHNPSPTDRLAVMFTSGTTSEPKGVVLTQHNYAHVGRAMAQAAKLKAGHRWFVTLPLFHANAQYYCFAPAIYVGASVALTASFSASQWVAQSRELNVTHASLFAAPIRMILARCPADEAPVSLEHVWFAQSLGAEHHREFGRLCGTLPRQLYGMTETVAVVAYDHAVEPRPDVIGSPAEGRTVRVVDPASGAEVTGSPGELFVLGTRGADLFAEYLDAPEINARVFDETPEGTWFRTGDLVEQSVDGVMRFVGRVDDVIKVAGENVSLTEVEAAVAQAPGVLEAAVLAQPDPIRDHVPVAYIVPKDPSNPPSASELETWASTNLAPAARPREWHFIAELPRTSVGKVRRFRLEPTEKG